MRQNLLILAEISLNFSNIFEYFVKSGEIRKFTRKKIAKKYTNFEIEAGLCFEEACSSGFSGWFFVVVFTLGIPKVQKNANLVDCEKCRKMRLCSLS